MMLPTTVVGGGLAGLTTATLLARDGVPVTLLESAPELGGRGRSSDRHGYRLNLGPHALATAGPGTDVLRGLGIELPGRAPAVHRARLLVGGRIVRPLERRRGGPGVRGLGPLTALARTAARRDPDGSIARQLAGIGGDARVRGALTALARLATYADGLEDQAADVLAAQLRAGRVRYLDDGWAALVTRLRRAAVDAGVEITPGVAVDRVLFDHTGTVTGVARSDGRRADAGAVVLAAGGPEAAAGLVDGPARATLESWARRATPVRLACLDVALRRRGPLPSLLLGTDEPLYLSVHSDRSRLAPGGGAVVHLARFLPPGTDAPADTRERLESLLGLAAPGWRDELVHARYLPGLTVTHDAGLVRTGGRRGRPGPAVAGGPGLFVAGDWVGTDGHLAQTSLASADAAARGVVRHLRTATPPVGEEQRTP